MGRMITAAERIRRQEAPPTSAAFESLGASGNRVSNVANSWAHCANKKAERQRDWEHNKGEEHRNIGMLPRG
jgi:hypothetical protein